MITQTTPITPKLKETLQTNSQNSNISFQLKGRLFTLSVIQLQNMDTQQLDKELAEKIKLAPKFFEHAPVVIDVSKIKSIRNEMKDINEKLKMLDVKTRNFKAEVENLQQEVEMKDAKLKEFHSQFNHELELLKQCDYLIGDIDKEIQRGKSRENSFRLVIF